MRRALANLDEEAAFISADDPAAARIVVERILTAVARLADDPAIGRPGRVPGTRELVVGRTRYLVPYRVRGEVVEILRVFHASRRPPSRG
ncbi:MAG: type II toxin-antitoxin system RelE/ParE family toxin [Gammaproteobacteria bacterium]|nr:type II toxin-antitoxin system RelE/ParE family toxin [Gammaproteobacteria bacterium]